MTLTVNDKHLAASCLSNDVCFLHFMLKPQKKSESNSASLGKNLNILAGFTSIAVIFSTPDDLETNTRTVGDIYSLSWAERITFINLKVCQIRAATGKVRTCYVSSREREWLRSTSPSRYAAIGLLSVWEDIVFDIFMVIFHRKCRTQIDTDSNLLLIYSKLD